MTGIAVIALTAGIWANYPGLVALGLGATTAVAAAVIGLATASRLQVERVLPARPVARLTPLEVVLRIRNPSTQVTRGFRAAEYIAGQQKFLDQMQIGPGATADVTFSVDTTLPGVVTLGPFVLRQTSFATLASLRWTDGATQEVTILARTLPVELPTTGARPLEIVQPDRLEGGGTELRSLRHYIQGDDLRKVNAFVSARFGTLMIRQDAEPSVMSLCVLIDNRAGLDPLAYAEMLDIATSVCAAAADQSLQARWAGRSMVHTESVEYGAMTVTATSIARLALTDADLPRSSDGDFTIVITGPDIDIADLAADVGGHGDHRLLVILAVDEEGGSTGGSVVHLTYPRAEEMLRSFTRLDGLLAGSAR